MIKRFKEIGQGHVSTCGGKGASLGELMSSGFPFANGFVLTTKAFGQDSSQREKEVLHAFKTLDSKFVAVRSSATKEDGVEDSFAGQFDTFLFVDKNNLIEKIKECHLSVHSDRINAYCESKGINQSEIKVAVVIQKMINSEVAGVAFTANPVTNNLDEIMIEGAYGLGEAVVSGMVTPDNYLISKKDLAITSKYISEQSQKVTIDTIHGGTLEEEVESTIQGIQKLSDAHIVQLAQICANIEKHYGKPMDIEWALEDGKLYILQARPITTLSKIEQDNRELGVRNRNKKLYIKEFARDFSLPLIQLWTRGESTDARQWTEETQPFIPYIVFERTHKTINCYMDSEGIMRIKSKLSDYIEEDDQYIKSLVGKLSLKLDRLQPIYDNPRILSHEELVNYIEHLRDMRVLFEGMWRLMDLLSGQNHDDFSLLKEVRERTNHMSTGSDKVIRDSLCSLYPDLGKLSSVLLYEEIKNRAIPSKEILQKRYLHYIYTNDELFLNETLEGLGKKFNITFQKDLVDGIDILNGQVAYRGVIRGKVRILMGSIDNNLVEEGEVVVSSMTMPDMMPALYRASAFVTDEGGITCHAAIVARELGKPCIIGTKIASQVLKDGDLVEVDADNGIVRILERKEDESKVARIHYLTRPFSLFGSSLWYMRYADYAQRLCSKDISDMMSIEEQEGLVRNYRTPHSLEHLEKSIVAISLNERDRCLSMLHQARELNKQAQQYLNKEQVFDSFESALQFFFENALYSTIFPHFLLQGLDAIGHRDVEIFQLGVELRGSSYYPQLLEQIVKPMAKDLLSSLGVDDAESAIDIITIQELLERNTSNISKRIQERQAGNLYKYEVVNHIPLITWYKDTSNLISDIEGKIRDDSKLSGQVAFAGKVAGVARIVKSIDGKDTMFNQGDILVSINSNPNLMHLIEQAGAIVTDEGGITCHAAIVSRELRIPCIIGTKIATQVLKDGDLVEVDADNGVVRILEMEKAK